MSKKQKVDTKGTVEISAKNTVGNSAQDNTEEVIAEKVFETQPAIVIFKHGETINKGDFNSVRIDVGIHIPCDVADVDQTFEVANEWVEERLKLAIVKGNDLLKGLAKEKQHPF
jgi:hypothetical protein